MGFFSGRWTKSVLLAQWIVALACLILLLAHPSTSGPYIAALVHWVLCLLVPAGVRYYSGGSSEDGREGMMLGLSLMVMHGMLMILSVPITWQAQRDACFATLAVGLCDSWKPIQYTWSLVAIVLDIVLVMDRPRYPVLPSFTPV